MKAPLFHVGQAVVCVLPVVLNESVAPPQAKLGAIYTVNLIITQNGIWRIRCSEWQDQRVCVEEKGFAPAELLPDEALAELLEEVFTPVHA